MERREPMARRVERATRLVGLGMMSPVVSIGESLSASIPQRRYQVEGFVALSGYPDGAFR
jgi:hypothetical protein